MLITRSELGETATLAVLEAARARAQGIGVPQSIAVVDCGGRVPAIVDGACVGAIGVGSGSPEDDVAVAEAGLATLR